MARERQFPIGWYPWALGLLLVTLLPGPAEARPFDFDDASLQGWTLYGALDPDNEDLLLSHEFEAVWCDEVNFPSEDDPTGDRNGSFGMLSKRGDGIDNPDSLWWEMQMVSPPLSGRPSWQTASGCSVKLFNALSGEDLAAYLSVTVWDHYKEELREFDNGDPEDLPSMQWSELSLHWSLMDLFPDVYTVVAVRVNVRGFVGGNYRGTLHLDDVTPLPLECGEDPAVQQVTPQEPVQVVLDRCRRKRVYAFDDLPEGGTLVLSLVDEDARGSHSLYASWGRIPSRDDRDHASSGRDVVIQQLVISPILREPLFLCVEANVPGKEPEFLELRSDVVALALEGFSASRVGSRERRISGSVRGGGFREGLRLGLVPSGGDDFYRGQDVLVVSSNRAEAVFDLTDAPLGMYDLVAQGGNSEAVLRGAFEVGSGQLGPVLELSLTGPDFYRYDRVAILNLTYRNVGDVEMRAPLVKLMAPDETLLRLERDPEFRKGALQVLCIDPDGVAGRLPPGAGGTLPIAFRSTGCAACPLRFEAHLLTPNRLDPIAWDQVPAPEGMTAEDWESTWPRLAELLGTRWLEYATSLSDLATRLSHRGALASSVRELFRFAVREAQDRPTQAILGTLRAEETLEPLAGQAVLAILDGEGVRSSTETDRRGNFALDWLRGGETYRIAATDYDLGEARVEIPREGDITALELLGVPAPGGPAPACPDCDASGLPEAPVDPPAELFTLVAHSVVNVVSSWDPNEKDGPVGQGEEQFIGAGDELLYRVYFENEADATAPAQRVEITDQLSPSLDWTSFRMLDFQVGGSPQTQISVVDLDDDLFGGYSGSSSGSEYSGSLNVEVVQVGDEGTETVAVAAEYELDLATGQVRWVFESDASDPLGGFLLPNDDLQQGEGFVSFAASARDDLSDGSEIENDAEIVFDNLNAVTTNTWRNVVSDFLEPGVPSNPVPADTTAHAVDTDVTLSWSEPDHTDTYDVFLWREGEPKPAGPTESGLSLQALAPSTTLEVGTVYHWQVVAKNAIASTQGPEWSFRTLGSLNSFQRGDAKADGTLNITDAINVLSYLFLGTEAPTCLKAADVDDDGSAAITDAIYLLNFLFLGGPEPPAPYPGCGADSTSDVLSCDAHPPCG